MTNKLLPAGLDCIGCHFCEVRVDNNDQNILVCVSTAQADPLDAAVCYTAEDASEAARKKAGPAGTGTAQNEKHEGDQYNTAAAMPRRFDLAGAVKPSRDRRQKSAWKRKSKGECK